MTALDALLEPIRTSPLANEAVAVLQRELTEERKRRETFYAEMTPAEKVEFIGGEVVVHSPVKDRHIVAKDGLSTLMKAHVMKHQLGLVRGEKSLCVFPRNDYEPDVIFFGLEKSARIKPDTMKYPVPDFIAEVLSDSTMGNDRGVKFQDYAANGVGEYWIVDPQIGTVEQYVPSPDGTHYELRQKVNAGELESVVVQGFVMPVKAFFDETAAFAALRSLLQ